jgi:hypothetical protein
LARLIDASHERSVRQRSDELTFTDENELSDSETVVLNPFGNTPMKLYVVSADRVPELANVAWTPPLHLTPEERNVVESVGTTLLLGRSGTGKTVCLCNKIDLDRQLVAANEGFAQLFVARSHRLWRLVKETVACSKHVDFTTFGEFISKIENDLLPIGSKLVFLPSHRMDFQRFKREVYKDSKNWDGVDALLIWTIIRSFLKGSVEAIQSPNGQLSECDYTSTEKMGRKRCRLRMENRSVVYRAFRLYESFLSDHRLWDDCDRISQLLRLLQTTKECDPDAFKKVCYSKIYVDEVQDYTQAEILLFFLLSGPGDLFFCGDPAQSIVQGVDFRFEDIRSVGYFVAGSERKHLVPQKPLTVRVNFRSHAGILNVAAAVLSRMFAVYPDSAKQLGEDRGMLWGRDQVWCTRRICLC